jgi:hypothetical protein
MPDWERLKGCVHMQYKGSPGLEGHNLAPFQHFEKFARMIVMVPKSEADKKSERVAKRTPSEETERSMKPCAQPFP